MPKGGARAGAGRKAKPRLPALETANRAIQLLEALNRPANEKDSYEIKRWRLLTEAMDLRIQLDARTRLDDKAYGRAVHTVNHLHDKPIEMNVTVTLSEAIQKARKRAGLVK